jgi:hypothetical protein
MYSSLCAYFKRNAAIKLLKLSSNEHNQRKITYFCYLK